MDSTSTGGSPDFVMVDIETTGTDPAHSAIIQIAAVAFNLKEKTIDHDFFNECLAIPSTRFWDESTRDWWLNTNEPLLLKLLQQGQLADDVMFKFISWVGAKGRVRLAAKPVSFESPFLESYCRMVNLPNPFRYYESLDVNSYIEAKGHVRKEFWDNLPFEGEKHDAIFDVLHQIKGLFHA
jgi:oligoribonuclease (3'-5' exoribonuclease)